jgi:hypothetical protein
VPNQLNKANRLLFLTDAVVLNIVTFNKSKHMRRLLAVSAILAMVLGCEDSEMAKGDFTGNEITYMLYQGSDYPVSGTVTLKERMDHTTTVVVIVTGTEGNLEHPVHLHRGTLATPGAEVAALLNPVVGSSGKSETTLTMLSDETPIMYEELLEMEACIKVHLSASGEGKDIVLAGGNIGTAEGGGHTHGRMRMAVCK